MKTHDFPEIIGSFRQASNEMLAAVLDQSVDCIKVVGVDGTLDFMNRNGQCAMEIDDFASVAGKFWWDLWPAETAPLVRSAFDGALLGESSRFEAFCPTAKGTPRWWDVSVTPLRDGDGRVQGLASVSRDITDRVRVQELRTTAAEEMRHRLQNAYALSGAIVMAAAKGPAAHQEFAGQILDRLQRLGIVQPLLVDPSRVGDPKLDILIRQLTEPFCEDGELQVGALPDVTLDDHQARALALAIGELSTNSNKYGALGRGGSVRIDGVLKDSMLELSWSEQSGIPVVATSREGGSGFALIRRALASEGGSLDLTWQENGLEAVLVMPVSTS